ncbi:MAG: hypothetical protein ACI9YE_003543, partial [Psychroserpens sp.]
NKPKQIVMATVIDLFSFINFDIFKSPYFQL